ncbi:MAG: DUF2905 domain-containing protein [Calditrichia bacterium]|nr:DUF2905 domain-containing protein [Calditrichia bacterium]
MDYFQNFGRIFVIIGIIFLVLGVLFIFGNKIPYFGRLPGDFVIQKKNFTFYFPITTLIVLNSLVLLLIYLFKK